MTASHLPAERLMGRPDVGFYDPDTDRVVHRVPSTCRISRILEQLGPVVGADLIGPPVHVRITPGAAVELDRDHAERLSSRGLLELSPVRPDAARTLDPAGLLTELGLRPARHAAA
jgi:hypothetical protein